MKNLGSYGWTAEYLPAGERGPETQIGSNQAGYQGSDNSKKAAIKY
jgi:hypothetical protein